MTLKTPSRMSTDKMTRQPPTLTLIVPPELDYGRTLQQTKTVYDQLLADKHSKLYHGLLQRKQEYDAKCAQLAEADKSKALEFGVRAQEALNKLCLVFSDELADLRKDYQEKLNRMYTELDKASRATADKPSGPPVDCKMFPHK